MPTFTAIALDTLLEPGASKSVDKSIPRPVPRPGAPNSRLDRRNGASVPERKPNKRPPLTPSLYATPEATPLPDSPTSFPPSPYIVNHKRRGPRLLKSSSEGNVPVASRKSAQDEAKEKGNGNAEGSETKVTLKIAQSIEEPRVNGSPGVGSSNDNIRDCNMKIESSDGSLGNGAEEIENGKVGNGIGSLNNGWAGSPRQVPSTPERDSEREDFYDPRESLSFTSSTDVEDNAEGERSARIATPTVEFYDAWEELSTESGQQQSASRNVEAELREMRLSFVMEIEKRKQAEEALSNMQNQWQNLRRRLSLVGLKLPADLTMVEDNGEELCRQVHLARFVANTIGRGLARAELEAEMEKQIEAKNFEIARLCDKLRNYEAMNQEMVQRNRDVLETARRERMKKERRQRWVWGSLAAALTLGAAGLAWSYLPPGMGPSSSSSSSSLPLYDSEAPQSDSGENY